MAEVLVIGAGLTGSLAALALAEAGADVTLLAPAAAQMAAAAAPPPAASQASYGGVPPWAGSPHAALQALAATGAGCWQALERRHGPLGWRPCRLWLHWSPEAEHTGVAAAARQELRQLGVPLPAEGPATGLDDRGPGGGNLGNGHTRSLALAYSRVDGLRLQQGLAPVLGRLCRLERGRAVALGPAGAGERAGWWVQLADGRGLEARQVVLATGAGLAPLLRPAPARWRWGWAGLLRVPPSSLQELEATGGAAAIWLERARQGDIVMPLLGRRQRLETLSSTVLRGRGCVDAGLAAAGADLLLGQDTWLGPELRLGHPPEPQRRERHLRRGLARAFAAPALARLAGSFEQVPVSYCLDGLPLVGERPSQPGLWLFSGFSGGYALVPPLAPLLAAAIGGDRHALAPLAELAA